MRKKLFKMLRHVLLGSCLIAGNGVMAQGVKVSGVVVSAEDSQPLPGATVLEKGTSNGTATDIDGNYSLTLTTRDAVLVFSMVGLSTQEIRVGVQSVINVTLKSDNVALQEVVITGYSAQKKADLTGAVSVIKMDEVMKVAENNPVKAMQGKVAGMTVTADGSPSGAATVRIRGIGTLNNNDPLYVIDGVPTKAGMHELNANDIESMQILKDASAASIYGSRAANGVIIITTKQGKQGKLRVTLDASVTNSWYADKIDMLNTKEYGQVMWQAYVNEGSNPNSNTIGYRYDWGYAENGRPVLRNMMLPKFLDDAHTMPTSDTKWFDEVSKSGLTQSYNLSLSNGTEKGKYFFSLGYYNNDGLIRNTGFERISGRINSDYKLFGDLLTIGENLTVNRTEETQAPGGILNTALQALPLIPVHTQDGGWGGPTGSMNDRDNPVRILDANKDNTYQYWRVFGNAYINLNPVKGLNLKSSFGIDYGNYYRQDFVYSYIAGKLSSDLSATRLNQGHWIKWTWSNTATYNLTVGDHQLDALLGVEAFKEDNVDFTSYREGFYVEDPDKMWPDLGIGKSSSTGTSTGYALLSFFGKIDYVYSGRYLASVTVRRDGSSRFGKNNRFGTFPAFSLGWRLSEEAFLQGTKGVLSDLKLRFGWGQTGNQEISNTAIYRIYVTDYGTGDPTWGTVNGTSYDITGTNSSLLPSGFKLTQLANDDLKWETTTQSNFGVDFGFLDHRLYGSAEYYIKKTKDILVLPPYLAAIGEGGNRWMNGASMENRGFEVSVGYRKETESGFSYDITANISGNRNKVTRLPEEVENAYGGNGKGDNILGHSLNSMYGYVADGIFRTQEEVDAHVRQDGKGLGRIRYRNLNDDDVIDDADRTWIGNPYPDFTYGLNLNLSFRNFDLSLFFQGVQHVDVVNEVKYHTDFWAVSETGSNKGRRLLSAWSTANPDSDIPAVSRNNNNDEGRMSTYFVEDGSFLKLRNIQFGYTLPKAILEKWHLDKLRIYVSGQNLWTVKSKSFTGVDPENPNWGYPIPMTFTGGLTLSF